MGSFVDAANAVAAIGDLVQTVRGSLSQDWSGRVAFNSRAKELHSAMLAIQCMIGGSKDALKDTLGNEICPANTRAACALPPATIQEWRTLRDGFGAFWRAAVEQGDYTNAEAQRLKDYATAFHDFYVRIDAACKAQGVVLPNSPSTPQPVVKEKGLSIGLMAVAVGTAVGIFYLTTRQPRAPLSEFAGDSLKKDIKQLMRIAQEQGWEVSNTNGGHLRWRPPNNAPLVFTASTPSDRRAIHRILRDLQRSGLRVA